jgi:hypothetical protein
VPDGSAVSIWKLFGQEASRGDLGRATPTALFQAKPREMIATSEQFSYDVSKDGQKFLINTQLKTAVTPMSVVLNWSTKLN